MAGRESGKSWRVFGPSSPLPSRPETQCSVSGESEKVKTHLDLIFTSPSAWDGSIYNGAVNMSNQPILGIPFSQVSNGHLFSDPSPFVSNFGYSGSSHPPLSVIDSMMLPSSVAGMIVNSPKLRKLIQVFRWD